MTTKTERQKETKVGHALATTKQLIGLWGWGCHCAPDAFYAHIINATREYLDRQPSGYTRSKHQVAESHWKLLALWFANGREDLQDDLLGFEPACWQDFGFPADIVEKLKDDIVETEAKLATKE